MTSLPPTDGILVHDALEREDINRARKLHGSCYLDAGYVSELSDEGTIDDEWVDKSRYLLAIDSGTQQALGTCRLIGSSPSGFPIFQHFDVLDDAAKIFSTIDTRRFVEVSALATPREGRENLRISAALYSAVWQSALLGGHTYVLATMDYRLFRMLRRQFHFPFELLGQARDYMGSTTVPVSVYLPRAIVEFRDNHPAELSYFSGPISYDQLNALEIELRDRAPEFRSDVIDLRELSEQPLAH